MWSTGHSFRPNSRPIASHVQTRPTGANWRTRGQNLVTCRGRNVVESGFKLRRSCSYPRWRRWPVRRITDGIAIFPEVRLAASQVIDG